MTWRIKQPWFYAGYAALSAAIGLSSGCSASGTQSSSVRGSDAATGGEAIDTAAAGGSSASSAGPGFTPGGASTINIDPASMAGAAGAATCGSDSQEAMTVPLALFILLDQSGSMTQDGNRWTPVTTALKTFIAGPSLTGVGIGLQYFPLGATVTDDPKICVSTNYSTADVPLQDLPANGAALSSSIDKHYFTVAQAKDPTHWGTPTYPALEGSYAYLRTYLAANPTRRGVLLLATDGLPSKLCMGDTPAEIATLIASQVTMTPPIETYVIGIGKITTLNTWAMAGGTGSPAFLVDGTGVTTQADLTNALDQIRVSTIPCDYAIPTPANGTVDPNKVNVRVTSPMQVNTYLLNVANAAACAAGAQTWYYDNLAAPTRVVMCPATCDALHQQGAKIELVFGCATQAYVPK